jgi:hypothetical protein
MSPVLHLDTFVSTFYLSTCNDFFPPRARNQGSDPYKINGNMFLNSSYEQYQDGSHANFCSGAIGVMK